MYDVHAIASDDVWAVGGGIVEGSEWAFDYQTVHWDGVSWSDVDNPDEGVLLAVAATSTSDVWAVGWGMDDLGYSTGTQTLHYRDCPAVLKDFTVAFGSLISGGLQHLEASDDSRVHARSDLGFVAHEPNVVDLQVGALTTVQDATLLDLTVEGRISQSGGISKLRLRNWSTNSFQQVHQYPIGTTETMEVIGDVPATDRVRRSDGRIELSIRQTMVATFTVMGFDSFTDHVAITVR
jgi:hypothetical protein